MSALVPGATAPWGTVRATPESGTLSLAPDDVTVAHVVNLGSHFRLAEMEAADAEDPDDVVVPGGGGDAGGGGGSGVEVMAKVGLRHLSKVPPPIEAPGLV